MAILACLKHPSLFSSLPSTPLPNDPSTLSSTPQPPIPIPKYPQKSLKTQTQKPQNPTIPKNPINPQIPKYPQNRLSPQTQKPTDSINPAFKTTHRRSQYFKPVREGVISTDGERSVTIGESGVSYRLPGAPFEFQFSYSETPKVRPLAIREPAFLPFAPPTMNRPWTGKAPLKKAKRKGAKLFEPFGEAPGQGQALVREVKGEFPFGRYPKVERTREEILGEPLKKWEVQVLLQERSGKDNRQTNLGRDGLTHNMLELIHSHWKRQSVCKVRCKGVPTVDMKNICKHLEEKTGGKIIHRAGGVVYLYRGRNYDYRTRPQYPIMLWKPATPVYPKLIQDAPEGLTESEANALRKKGKKLLPICKLAKNGVYITLVRDVRHAFEASPIVKIDCKGMHTSDYKKLGAKLKDLVPCVLLSFDDEKILMWRGRDWKSLYRTPLLPRPIEASGSKDDSKAVNSSPKMVSLWQRAINSSKAFLLGDTNLGPDELLKKVEEFTGMSQAAEHSYTASVVSANNDDATELQDDPQSEGYGGGNSYSEYDLDADDFDDSDSDSDSDEIFLSAPLGSLPVDQIAKRLIREKNDDNNLLD